MKIQELACSLPICSVLQGVRIKSAFHKPIAELMQQHKLLSLMVKTISLKYFLNQNVNPIWILTQRLEYLVLAILKEFLTDTGLLTQTK